jgi:cysteinyl-tRNA synthetase
MLAAPMLRLFNTYGKKLEAFRPAGKGGVDIFTCGPSVYQKSHIGNFRTFLFEDVILRYLEYQGHTVRRGMNVTDVEDKAVEEARKRKIDLRELTEGNIEIFLRGMDLLNMKTPDLFAKASEAVDAAAEITGKLLARKIAYWHGGNVYFDPLKFPRFGELYGLDMSRWPKKKRRFHKDTYPGMRWNLGDFILWRGCDEKAPPCWETKIGKGRPAWNIQDPSILFKYYHKSLSIYCGGIDNLIRHHDYSRAILESVRPYPMAKFWLHCRHLVVDGKKMSKSLGNIYYIEDLLKEGYSPGEIRFFLIYGHYRKRLNYSKKTLASSTGRLRGFRSRLGPIKAAANSDAQVEEELARALRDRFTAAMDEDLNVGRAFDAVDRFVTGIRARELRPGAAAGLLKALKEIDSVFQAFFP